jgi:hypothetical protein
MQTPAGVAIVEGSFVVKDYLAAIIIPDMVWGVYVLCLRPAFGPSQSSDAGDRGRQSSNDRWVVVAAVRTSQLRMAAMGRGCAKTC